jgi:DivIVA domain-containing protein
MELTPQALHAVEFREAKRRGYNTRDVDDFIERVATGVGQLHERLREAQARADAADARMADMQRELEEARRRPMSPEAAETDETLRRTLVLAQRTADATIKEAKEEANRVLSEAREESARTRAEAEADARRGAESARMAAEAEVESLLATRDQLARDHEVLHKRLGDQRANIRAGVNELQRLLDDPSALRQVPAPTLAEVEPPAHAAPPVAAGNGDDAQVPAGSGAGAGTDNGQAPPDDDSPFAPGEQVAAIQEPAAPDLGPPTQPVPFGLTGDGRGPWQPSDLRPGADDPLGPLPAPPPGPPNGAPTPTAGPTEPASRPSEWDKAVFDPDAAEGGDRARFGRRR